MAEPSGNELASAAAKGDLVQLTNLLQKNVNVNAQNGFGRTALQVGIQRGRKYFITATYVTRVAKKTTL
mgnify:CR=1 FL=1